MDEMLIKFKSLDNHLANLEENFILMKNNKVRTNPAKCVFKAIVGILGFMLIEKGIEVNLVKSKAILEMRIPTIMNEV